MGKYWKRMLVHSMFVPRIPEWRQIWNSRSSHVCESTHGQSTETGVMHQNNAHAISVFSQIKTTRLLSIRCLFKHMEYQFHSNYYIANYLTIFFKIIIELDSNREFPANYCDNLSWKKQSKIIKIEVVCDIFCDKN